MNQLLRIVEIQTTGLFGLYDHVVPLSLDDRVTIIHGPNGIGKTVLLRLVNAFVLGNFFLIYKIPFNSFQLTLSDGTLIGVRKNALTNADSEQLKLKLNSDEEGESVEKSSNITFFRKLANHDEEIANASSLKSDAATILRRIDSEVPWISRIDKNQWVDQRTDVIYSAEEIIATYGAYGAYGEELSAKTRKLLFSEPEWLTETRKKIKIHLIETQRLLRISNNSRRSSWHDIGTKDSVVTTVQNYAKELLEKITKELAEYAKISQSLDQSFPQRLLNGSMQSLEINDLKNQMEKIEEKRTELQKVGLLDEDTTYPFDIKTLEKLESSQRSVMTLYVDDTAQKLGVLNDLAQRVKLLLNNINKKFRNKRIAIDKKNGLIAIDMNGNQLDLDTLSSGEQHELVLIYDLLFRVNPNTMVLIDEPELSLHISWQKVFLSDLLEIVHTANFDVLLATHSPFIAGERTDLMIALGDGENSK